MADRAAHYRTYFSICRRSPSLRAKNERDARAIIKLCSFAIIFELERLNLITNFSPRVRISHTKY